MAKKTAGNTGIQKVKVCGASDDLIEVEGALNEEFGASSGEDTSVSFVGFSDGTVLRVAYGENGEGFWRITRVVEGARSSIILQVLGSRSPA